MSRGDRVVDLMDARDGWRRGVLSRRDYKRAMVRWGIYNRRWRARINRGEFGMVRKLRRRINREIHELRTSLASARALVEQHMLTTAPGTATPNDEE